MAEVVSLGERLKERREQLGISQAEAARELDVARTAYRLWEMEAAKPAPDRWRLLSRWLGVSVATMLLAEDLVEADEARQADVISGRFGSEGWDEKSARERGDYFDQERSMIARAAAQGRLNDSEAADLMEVLDRVELRSVTARMPARRSAEFRKDLPSDRSAPGLARAALLVAAAGVPEQQLLDAELLTSELVVNSVQHGPTDAEVVTLRISVDRTVLRVEVGDSASRAARPRTPDENGGWGLTLVMELASRWGAGRSAGKNMTWFELDLPRPALEEPASR